PSGPQGRLGRGQRGRRRGPARGATGRARARAGRRWGRPRDRARMPGGVGSDGGRNRRTWVRSLAGGGGGGDSAGRDGPEELGELVGGLASAGPVAEGVDGERLGAGLGDGRALADRRQGELAVVALDLRVPVGGVAGAPQVVDDDAGDPEAVGLAS